MEPKKIFNLLNYLLVFCGILFKAEHWPGANILLILSATMLIIGLILYAFTDNAESGMPRFLNYLLLASAVLMITGAIFRIMHWNGGQIIAVIAYALAFLLPVVLVLFKGSFQVSRQFFFTYLMLMVMVLALMRNNPIAQFLGQGRDYTVSEAAASMAADSLHSTDNSH